MVYGHRATKKHSRAVGSREHSTTRLPLIRSFRLNRASASREAELNDITPAKSHRTLLSLTSLSASCAKSSRRWLTVSSPKVCALLNWTCVTLSERETHRPICVACSCSISADFKIAPSLEYGLSSLWRAHLRMQTSSYAPIDRLTSHRSGGATAARNDIARPLLAASVLILAWPGSVRNGSEVRIGSLDSVRGSPFVFPVTCFLVWRLLEPRTSP